MAYDLKKRLVIGVASSALFDLQESDSVFQSQGEEAYRQYQQEHLDQPLPPGVAFSFIKRILTINDLVPHDPLTEVILLSRNDPDTGLRVFRSIQHYDLPITRAAFLQGQEPYKYISPFSISLFLSANEQNVRKAVDEGYPAGLIVGQSTVEDNDETNELRIAFDFDGVLANDASERVFKAEGLEKFHSNEKEKASVPLEGGPLREFLERVSAIQNIENERAKTDTSYKPRLRISIITARNAPAHERVITTLRDWNILVNEAFFLGGVEKSLILETLKPHIFFDDQITHLKSVNKSLALVHVPFGIANATSVDMQLEVSEVAQQVEAETAAAE